MLRFRRLVGLMRKKERDSKKEESLEISIENCFNKKNGKTYPGGFDWQKQQPMGTRQILIKKK